MNEYLFLTAEILDLMTLIKTNDIEKSFAKFNKQSKHTKIEGRQTENFKIAKFKHRKIEVTFSMVNSTLQFNTSKLLNLIASQVLLDCYCRHKRIEECTSVPLSEVRKNVRFSSKEKLEEMIEVLNSITLHYYSKNGKELFKGKVELMKCERTSDGLKVCLPEIENDGFDIWKKLLFYFEKCEWLNFYHLNNLQFTLFQLCLKYRRQTAHKQSFNISESAFLLFSGLQDTNERRTKKKLKTTCRQLDNLQNEIEFECKNDVLEVTFSDNFSK